MEDGSRSWCPTCTNPPPPKPSIHDDLVAAAKLLLQQYDSSGDFTMGGNLTNEPFLLFRAALARAKDGA
mgnify:CR=1 FL=1